MLAGFLLGFAIAAAYHRARNRNVHIENLIMVRPAAARKHICYLTHMPLLYIFLKHGLVILMRPAAYGALHRRADKAHYKALCRIHAAVNVQSAYQRLHSVAQYARLLPAAGMILPAPKQKRFAEFQLFCNVIKRAFAHRLRPKPRHVALVIFGKAVI